MNERGANYQPTPGEEALFRDDPELGKLMEELRDEESWRRMKMHRLKAELHLERAGRIIDEMKRSL